MRRTLLALLSLVPALIAAGCSTATTDELAIVGTWTDEFGTVHEIDEARWTQTYPGYDPLVFDITAWDGAERWVVAQNGAGNAFDPGLWSRFDWAEPGDGQLYYCQSAYAEASEAEALATPASDAGDLDAGCGGFPWTDLTP